MSLSTDQISIIRDFIHSRGFKHIEVEVEILDHVASAVEEKLQADPDKSLQKAIHEVHASFGVMGFSVFEEETIKGFGKLMRKQAFTNALTYFTTAKVFLTLSLFLLGLMISYTTFPLVSEYAYHLFFLILGFTAVLVVHLRSRLGTQKWFKRSVVISQLGTLGIFGYSVFGQGFGTCLKWFVQQGHPALHPLFAVFFTITLLYAFIYYDTARWAYRWTYERYLKYAG